MFQKQEEKPITDNSLINLMRHACMKILCKEMVKIIVVTSKTHRPLIQIKSVKGMEQKCLFDTGAGLTCMSLEGFRQNASCLQGTFKDHLDAQFVKS
jgi:hypothetical protein